MRGDLLGRVYESLERQTDKDFEWIIVADVSNDDSENVIANIKKKATFPIVY